MKQASNSRRGRNRNNGKRNQNQNFRGRSYDGSDPKMRGSAQQILDKYLALARDASVAGDRIAAEGFQQHAEHFYRVLHPDQGPDVARGGSQNERKARFDKSRKQSPEHGEKPAPQPENQPQPDEPVQASQNPPEPAVEAVAPEAAAPQPVNEISPPEAVIEKSEAPAPETIVASDEIVEKKPRRRGRPRKTEAAEPVA